MTDEWRAKNHKAVAKDLAEVFGCDWKLVEASLETLINAVLSGEEPYYREAVEEIAKTGKLRKS